MSRVWYIKWTACKILLSIRYIRLWHTIRLYVKGVELKREVKEMWETIHLKWENLPQFRMRQIPEGAITPFIRFCLKESLILLRRLCHKEMHQLWSKTSQKCPTLPSDQELRIFCQRDLRTSIKCPIRASITTKLLKWLGYSLLETQPKDWIICYKSTDLKY